MFKSTILYFKNRQRAKEMEKVEMRFHKIFYNKVKVKKWQNLLKRKCNFIFLTWRCIKMIKWSQYWCDDPPLKKNYSTHLYSIAKWFILVQCIKQRCLVCSETKLNFDLKFSKKENDVLQLYCRRVDHSSWGSHSDSGVLGDLAGHVHFPSALLTRPLFLSCHQ